MDSDNDRLNETSVGDKSLSMRAFRKIHTAIFVVAVIVVTVFLSTMIFVVAIFSRKLSRRLAVTWNRTVLGLGGIKIKTCGMEKLQADERYVFVSNHQSALDIPIIYTGLGANISFIAKKELFAIPFFGWAMSATGHISMDRQNARKARASLAKAARQLKKENVSLVLFPEGTRSKDGKVLEFKTASFTLALQAGASLVPVAIRDAIDRLPPHSSHIVPGEVILEVGNPIGVLELQGRSKTEICEQVRSLIKEMVER